MPIRIQPQSFGARLGGGIGEGMQTIGEAMMKQAQTERANTTLTNRELLKDYTDKVMSGALEPEQAEQALTSRGMKIPSGYFHTLQPSIEHELSKVIGGMGKADTTQAVEGPTALAAEPVVKRLPLKLGKFDSPSQPFTGDVPTPGIPQDEGTDYANPPDTPDQTLGSTQMQPFSPDFNNLLKIRDEKLNSFAPKEVQGVDANGVKNTQFVNSRPDQLTGRIFQAEPTGAQAGRQASNKDLSQELGNIEGGLPKLKGEAFTQQENAERGAKVTTAGATAKATSQAALDVQTNPANVQAEARKAAAIADATERARQIAERSGIPPEIANNFTNTTATGRSYAFIPPEIPMQERRVAVDTLVRPSGANPNGVKIVTKDQAAALQAIDKARADYDNLMTRFDGHLAQDPKGRPEAAIKNVLGIYLQTDPQLAAAVATEFPLVLQNLKANAGSVGRIMQIEVQKMQGSVPGPNDTWQAAQLKQIAMFQAFQNVENSILGHPAAKR